MQPWSTQGYSKHSASVMSDGSPPQAYTYKINEKANTKTKVGHPKITVRLLSTLQEQINRF